MIHYQQNFAYATASTRPFILTYDLSGIRRSRKSQPSSAAIGPFFRSKERPVIPDQTNMIPNLRIRSDVVVAGWNWHLMDIVVTSKAQLKELFDPDLSGDLLLIVYLQECCEKQ